MVGWRADMRGPALGSASSRSSSSAMGGVWASTVRRRGGRRSRSISPPPGKTNGSAEVSRRPLVFGFWATVITGADRTVSEVWMNDVYLEVISLVERLHRQFLEVVKLELDGLGVHDINNVQGMILFNIGNAEMTVGELMLRGCYLGSNVSYNVKKMVENGYLAQQRSVHDRRSIHVRLTEKGSKLRDSLTAMH